MGYKVLSIGQCGFDNSGLSNFCKKLSAEYIACASAEKALNLLERDNFSLIFVNRIFDSNGACGLSFIKDLLSKYPNQKVLLISNYIDKQKIAMNLGALKGIGKNDLNSESSLKLISSYLAKKV